jgi:hypothetical protein
MHCVHVRPIVVDQAKLTKPIHEKTDTRPSGADHLRQYFLVEARTDRLGAALFAVVRQKE